MAEGGCVLVLLDGKEGGGKLCKQLAREGGTLTMINFKIYGEYHGDKAKPLRRELAMEKKL